MYYMFIKLFSLLHTGKIKERWEMECVSKIRCSVASIEQFVNTCYLVKLVNIAKLKQR